MVMMVVEAVIVEATVFLGVDKQEHQKYQTSFCIKHILTRSSVGEN